MYSPSRIAARRLGVHPNTLRRWADEGKIPFIKSASGQRRYDVDAFLGQSTEPGLVCYCRVSSPKQRDDLDRQVEFMRQKYPQAEVIKDIGSGLSFKRKGLRSLLERLRGGAKLTLVVAHKDRLARFGFDLIKYLVEQNGGELVVLNQTVFSPEQELVHDITSIIHVFSCRLHGLRKYKVTTDTAELVIEPKESV